MDLLYPPLEPYDRGFLAVSPLHTLYYEQCGNPQGKPVVFLHGGPGGGLRPVYRQFFDPHRWRVVLLDQRGCGRSTPQGELQDNTTWDLVADLETLRRFLAIDRWMVFGGSWGSTLALAYSQTHPDRCTGLILRGIFLLRPQEIRWFYQEGAHALFPDAWESYLAPIPPAERGDLLQAYYRRLTGDDPMAQRQAAQAWSQWEGSTSHLIPNADLRSAFGEENFALTFARIECHYFTHGGFFDAPDQLLRGIDAIRHLPAVIIQGRYDVVCPMMSAWDLHRAWPEAEFQIIPDAGHSAFDLGILEALRGAIDRFGAMD